MLPGSIAKKLQKYMAQLSERIVLLPVFFKVRPNLCLAKSVFLKSLWTDILTSRFSPM